ncbi:MAG: hypothetical protein PHC66_03765 [Candidatus Nanoarchaeia archaeon]|nr:hypothetical protein [Candidatus Nanoarchaeia archaeon]MDD5239212.1 hypothetical protein [Candidatus Nanoarchaeia archaeon]
MKKSILVSLGQLTPFFSKERGRKGIVFAGLFMSLIISTVVVISLFTGTFISYDQLLCYTGVKWLLYSPAAHMGTADSLAMLVSVESISTDSYAECNARCDAKFGSPTEDPAKSAKDACTSGCTANFPKTNAKYAIVTLKVTNNGMEPAKATVHMYQQTRDVWSGTTPADIQSGSERIISTQYLEIDTSALVPCTLQFTADSSVPGIAPSENEAQDYGVCFK